MDKTEPSDTTETYARVAAPKAAPATDADVDADVAVIAWHGMGQQIRFETVETIVRTLMHNHPNRGYRGADKVRARFVQLGEEKMWRAELEVLLPGGESRRVHVYEVYWAPFTEGTISLRETIAFLVWAGLDGLRFCLFRTFRRHLFGEWRAFPVNWLAAAQLLTLLLVLTALIVMNAAVATAISASVLTGAGSSWPSYALLGDLTVDLALFEGFGALLLGVLYAVHLKHREYRRAAQSPPPPRFAGALIWVLIGLTVAATIGAGGLVARHLLGHRTASAPMWWHGPDWLIAWVHGSQPPLWSFAAVVAIWLVAVGVSYVLKHFLLQYVGDVAIYVVSHRLDRFFETRQKIREISVRAVQAIYEFGKYPAHVLVGHSLGSVIAYDTLNRMLNEDALRNGSMRVAPRTQVLLSLGSPLDKTAFLFRAQSEFSDVREAMAASAQPLVTNYKLRPAWVNIYSPNDPISGSLDYYDAPAGQDADISKEDKRVVENVADPQAWVPLLAHNQYWTNDLFVAALRRGIGSR